ncbi:HAD family hydrolase [Ferviditalea candida]|uniref:HAD family hydrolase n=1 Tax=Ferviditalea candida TaxID=3108399 RepID=A0ABU5ZQB2_9BACL|nr:HAD family hydrolase [Paenibacillaceae bacterium T2]
MIKAADVRIGQEKIKIKGIGFDKDGTLFDSVKFWSYIDRIRKRNFLETAGSVAEADWESTMGFVQPDTVDHNGVLAIATMDEEILLTAGLIYKWRKLPWHECKKQAKEIFSQADKMLKLEEAFQTHAGVPEIFHRLYENQVPAGILTSDAYQRTESLMKMLGIKEMLQFIITPEQVANGKPNPEMVIKACGLLDISPFEFMVVGDSIVDMKMAKAAGSIAVGLVTYDGSEQLLAQDADYLIRAITDIAVGS